MLCLKIAGWVANSVDPDETLCFAVSHLGLYCLLRPVCPNIYGKYGICDGMPLSAGSSLCLNHYCEAQTINFPAFMFCVIYFHKTTNQNAQDRKNMSHWI